MKKRRVILLVCLSIALITVLTVTIFAVNNQRVLWTSAPREILDGEYYLYTLESYPAFETIDELVAHIRDNMSPERIKIINDKMLRVQFTPHSTHMLGPYLEKTLTFSRHIGDDQQYDYFWIIDNYSCEAHSDCTIIKDTGERAAHVCPGENCQYH